MRQIVLDTETTGLDPAAGHRIIEIGCVELVDRRPTGRTFHQYLQPDREIEAGAVSVHGITDAFLRDKPRFGDIADELLGYLEGAELIIHNASFDLGFLDHELKRWRGDARPLAELCSVTDTLVLARTLHPSQRNSLDALCKRYGIDNSHRDRHGALLDAEILADVYLAMTGGQVSLFFGGAGQESPVQRAERRGAPARLPVGRPSLPVVRANDAELAAHDRQLAAIDKASGGHCLWRRSPRV
ncbi:DNA polymerase III subunit epsilon [Thioalkalicoccus limnaeus]|uniref:DNA polymerase III subunit epsilon n=1 Tax=Thioalkalicoccus limnaeus TaxID=120681 RepID=A0ABV4BAA2_9GAMM